MPLGEGDYGLSEQAVEVRGLEFHYRDGEFSLRLPELVLATSETVAVIGPSGTGKTTLLNLLAGCCVPGAGTVTVMGTDLLSLKDQARRLFRIQRIGMIFQEFELLDHLSVLDNITLPYRITPGLDYDRVVGERATRLACDVGLKTRLKRNVRHLSQGERQRVAVCRALVTEPSLLLCDEPTGNLDPDNTQRVLDMILGYADSRGATVVSVTHEHDLLPRFSRTIDIMTLASGGRP